MRRSASEFKALAQRADRGDGAAAYELYLYESLEEHDENAALPWLRRAAAARHPEAQRVLAYLIQSSNLDYQAIAGTRPEAVRILFSDACRTQSDACYELGSALGDGYFGTPDLVAARASFLRCAQMNNSMCWQPLASYLELGKGGPVDVVEAYYWVSLDAQFVDPQSVSGAEISALRERLASGLTLRDLTLVWERVDAYADGVKAGRVTLDNPPFLEGQVDPNLSRKGRSLARQQEVAHRVRLQSRTAEPLSRAPASSGGH